MFNFLFTTSFDMYLYTVIEDVFVILMLYSFLKLILLGSLVELLWPTQFFNRRSLVGISNFRLRTYTESLLKIIQSGLSVSTTIFLCFNIN